MGLIGGVFDRIFVVIGAFLFLQAPLFMHQYQQQLTGHVEELALQVGLLREAAKDSGKSLDQLVEKFLISADVDFARQGKNMGAMVVRWRDLSHALSDLKRASVFTRPWIFTKHLNSDIAKSTWSNFQAGFSFTIEGVTYALAGVLFGWVMYKLFFSFSVVMCSLWLKLLSSLLQAKSRRKF